MNARYLIALSISFVTVLGVIVIYFNQSDHLPTHAATAMNTRYDARRVEGPIQPIPNILEIDENWVALGKALFLSPLLSKDNSVSCASCHNLIEGGDDGSPVSTGVNQAQGIRNAPSVLNAVFNIRQFWDGRSHDLRDQISGPIHNPLEMHTSWPDVISKLKNNQEFLKKFLELSEEGVTQANILHAITIFEESLVTPNAPIDRYILGDGHALSTAQERGLKKFINFGCVTCHQGRNIGGNLFQKIGRIDRVPEFLLADLGRYNITANEFDRHVFKVPSLRNIALTAPYFHDGSVNDLKQAIRIMAQSQLGLDLNEQDASDLYEVLHAFTGETPLSLR